MTAAPRAADANAAGFACRPASRSPERRPPQPGAMYMQPGALLAADRAFVWCGSQVAAATAPCRMSRLLFPAPPCCRVVAAAMQALRTSFFGQTFKTSVVAQQQPSSNATRQVTCMAKKKASSSGGSLGGGGVERQRQQLL